jgi:hypothetical protein
VLLRRRDNDTAIFRIAPISISVFAGNAGGPALALALFEGILDATDNALGQS